MSVKFKLNQTFVDGISVPTQLKDKQGKITGLSLSLAQDKRSTKHTLEASGNQLLIWDTDARGFALRVTATSMSYVYQARVNGRNRRIKLGSHPAMRAATALRKAKVEAGQMAGGVDPVIEKKKHNLTGLTLQDAVNFYLGESDAKEHEGLGKTLKPRTVADVKKAMKSLDDWMTLPIKAITSQMCRQQHALMQKNSAARANLTFRYLRAILNYSNNELSPDVGDPLLEFNPVQRIAKGKHWATVSRRKSLVEDFPAFWNGLDQLHGRYAAEARDFFRFMALTGCRPNEAFSLQWAQVDVERKTITFIDTKNHDDHILPTGKWLTELLRQRQAISGDYVFSRPDGLMPSDPADVRNDFFRQYTKQMHLEQDIKFMPTDLRRGMATRLEQMGYGVFTIKQILNHRSGRQHDVTGGYVSMQGDSDLIRAVMQKVESAILDEVAATVEAAPAKRQARKADVIPINHKRA